jgi:hypothetical protein
VLSALQIRESVATDLSLLGPRKLVVPVVATALKIRNILRTSARLVAYPKMIVLAAVEAWRRVSSQAWVWAGSAKKWQTGGLRRTRSGACRKRTT